METFVLSSKKIFLDTLLRFSTANWGGGEVGKIFKIVIRDTINKIDNIYINLLILFKNIFIVSSFFSYISIF
jgi:hypothetical protein